MSAKPFDWEANKSIVTDSTGRKLTIGLFEELADGGTPPFKLSDWRKVYIELADPTDYKAALTLIGWDHWQALLKCKSFVEHLEQWRAEVDTKLRSNAIEELKLQSKGAKGTAAARWLAEQGGSATKRRVGRPASPEKQPEEHDRSNKDAARLGLSVVPGGKK